MTSTHVTLYYFCHILCVRSKSLSPVHVQVEGNWTPPFEGKSIVIDWMVMVVVHYKQYKNHISKLHPLVSLYLEMGPLRKFKVK